MDKNGYVMDAKEYFKQEYGHSYNVPFDSIEVIKFATRYHIAKSKEEGDARYLKAKEYAWKINELDPITFDNTLKIASGIAVQSPKIK